MRDVEFMKYLTTGVRPGSGSPGTIRTREAQAQVSARTVPWDDGQSASAMPTSPSVDKNAGNLKIMLEIAIDFLDENNYNAAMTVLSAVLSKVTELGPPQDSAGFGSPVYEAEGDEEPFIAAMKKLRGLFDQASEVLTEEHEELEPLRPGLEELSGLLDETAEDLGVSFSEEPADKAPSQSSGKAAGGKPVKKMPPAMKESRRYR